MAKALKQGAPQRPLFLYVLYYITTIPIGTYLLLLCHIKRQRPKGLYLPCACHLFFLSCRQWYIPNSIDRHTLVIISYLIYFISKHLYFIPNPSYYAHINLFFSYRSLGCPHNHPYFVLLTLQLAPETLLYDH